MVWFGLGSVPKPSEVVGAQSVSHPTLKTKRGHGAVGDPARL